MLFYPSSPNFDLTDLFNSRSSHSFSLPCRIRKIEGSKEDGLSDSSVMKWRLATQCVLLLLPLKGGVMIESLCGSTITASADNQEFLLLDSGTTGTIIGLQVTPKHGSEDYYVLELAFPRFFFDLSIDTNAKRADVSELVAPSCMVRKWGEDSLREFYNPAPVFWKTLCSEGASWHALYSATGIPLPMCGARWFSPSINISLLYLPSGEGGNMLCNLSQKMDPNFISWQTILIFSEIQNVEAKPLEGSSKRPCGEIRLQTQHRDISSLFTNECVFILTEKDFFYTKESPGWAHLQFDPVRASNPSSDVIILCVTLENQLQLWSHASSPTTSHTDGTDFINEKISDEWRWVFFRNQTREVIENAYLDGDFYHPLSIIK